MPLILPFCPRQPLRRFTLPSASTTIYYTTPWLSSYAAIRLSTPHLVKTTILKPRPSASLCPYSALICNTLCLCSHVYLILFPPLFVMQALSYSPLFCLYSPLHRSIKCTLCLAASVALSPLTLYSQPLHNLRSSASLRLYSALIYATLCLCSHVYLILSPLRFVQPTLTQTPLFCLLLASTSSYGVHSLPCSLCRLLPASPCTARR